MKKLFLIFSGILFLSLASGCGETKTNPTDTGNTTDVSTTENIVTRSSEELFSQRDMEVGYDETEAIAITLNQDSAVCDSDAVAISSTTVTISQEGTYLLSGSLNHGMVIVDAQKTDKIQLVLNNVSIQCDSSAPIYIKQADKVFLTLAPDSENTLTASEAFKNIDDNNIDGAIFSKDDLTINGSGTLTIHSNYGHGIVSKDDLVITGGTYIINAASHGLSGKDCVCVSDGDFTITAGKDGIHGANDDDASFGFLYIAGGTFHITAEDDGIHTDADVTIQKGTITIEKSYEGIEGKNIIIQGGTITVTSSDDGLNASEGSDSSSTSLAAPDTMAADDSIFIHITGGTLSINAGGDGVDSNGNLYVEGGDLRISGSENGGNSALDYNGEAKITGGTVAAAGFSGMAQNFGDTSTQGAMLVSFTSQTAGTEITLQNSENDTLLSYTPDKQYDTIIFSHPEIVTGGTYTIHCGDTDTEVTMDTLIYGNGMQNGFQAPGNRNDQPHPNHQNIPDEQTHPDHQNMPGGQIPPEHQDMPDGQIQPEKPTDENSPDSQNTLTDNSIPYT